MKKVFILFYLFSFFYSYAQNYESGQLLIEFKDDVDIRTFIQKYSMFDSKSTELKISEKLIPNMNYYLLEFNKTITVQEFLDYIDNDIDLKLVQKNHPSKFVIAMNSVRSKN
jgi:hypothetical protein